MQAEYAGVTKSGPAHVYINRIKVLKKAIKEKYDHVLFLETQARLTNPDALFFLIQQVWDVRRCYSFLLLAKNRTIISPLLLRTGTMFSNFWGGVVGED